MPGLTKTSTDANGYLQCGYTFKQRFSRKEALAMQLVLKKGKRKREQTRKAFIPSPFGPSVSISVAVFILEALWCEEVGERPQAFPARRQKLLH